MKECKRRICGKKEILIKTRLRNHARSGLKKENGKFFTRIKFYANIIVKAN